MFTRDLEQQRLWLIFFHGEKVRKLSSLEADGLSFVLMHTEGKAVVHIAVLS